MNERQIVNKIIHNFVEVYEYEDYTDYKGMITALIEWKNEALTLTDVSQQSELLFCGGCGNKKQLIVETDINSQRVCKNKLCKQNNCG